MHFEQFCFPLQMGISNFLKKKQCGLYSRSEHTVHFLSFDFKVCFAGPLSYLQETRPRVVIEKK